MASETAEIAKFVRETSYEDIPPAVVDEFKIFVLDAIGAGYIGSVQPWTKHLVEMVRGQGGKPETTVINESWKTDISRAALANGTMIGSFECEPLSGTHASGCVLPAVMAVCERERMGGKAFLTALILGAEVMARMSRTAVGLEEHRGFHNPGTQGPFGAAVAFGKLHDFDQETMVNAMGIAGSHAGGLVEFAWEGSDTKRMHLGRASQLGVESALLARGGFTGPSTILEGRFGYYNAFSLPTTLERLTEKLGQQWFVQPPWHKAYALHAMNQTVVHTILQFKKEHPFDPTKLGRIVIGGSGRTLEPRHWVRDTTTVMGGQYSMPFSVAIALTRDLSNPLVFDDAAMNDPFVRELAQRIEPMEIPNEAGAGVLTTVKVILEIEGQTYDLPVVSPKGSATNPFNWDDGRDKFERYAGQIIDKQKQQAIIDLVSKLENATDISDLCGAISG